MLVVIVVLALFGVWLYASLDAITTDPARVRNAPKLAWIVVLVLFMPISGVLWLWLGRPKTDGTGRGRPPNRPRRDHPAGDRPTTGRGPTRPLAPDDDPEFLRGLERRLRGDDGPPR